MCGKSVILVFYNKCNKFENFVKIVVFLSLFYSILNHMSNGIKMYKILRDMVNYMKLPQ